MAHSYTGNIAAPATGTARIGWFSAENAVSNSARAQSAFAYSDPPQPPVWHRRSDYHHQRNDGWPLNLILKVLSQLVSCPSSLTVIVPATFPPSTAWTYPRSIPWTSPLSNYPATFTGDTVSVNALQLTYQYALHGLVSLCPTIYSRLARHRRTTISTPIFSSRALLPRTSGRIPPPSLPHPVAPHSDGERMELA